MKQFISHNLTDTFSIARAVAERLHGGEVLALYGGMGAGKTAFVSALADALGYSGEVSSPTFAIVHEYRGGRLDLFHFDMYRIQTFDELYSTGFFEYCDAGGVVACEWSENIENALPEGCIQIRIYMGEQPDQRVFEIRGLSI